MAVGEPRRKISCWACGKPINGARTVINGFWHCADCTYKHDYPDKELPEPVKGPRMTRQKETLFPLPPKKEKNR